LDIAHHLHVLRGGGTSDDFNQLAGNDGLSGAVVQDLVLANHLASVLGGILRDFVSTVPDFTKRRRRITHVHGVSSGRLLAGVALGKSPVQGVGQAVLAEVGQDLVIDLERRDVGCKACKLAPWHSNHAQIQHINVRDWAMASSENASMKVGS